MEDLTKVITEIGKQVIRLEVKNSVDQSMSDPPINITPQKTERPNFETPGNQAKKNKNTVRKCNQSINGIDPGSTKQRNNTTTHKC